VINKNLNNCLKVITNIIISENYRPVRQSIGNFK